MACSIGWYDIMLKISHFCGLCLNRYPTNHTLSLTRTHTPNKHVLLASLWSSLPCFPSFWHLNSSIVLLHCWHAVCKKLKCFLIFYRDNEARMGACNVAVLWIGRKWVSSDTLANTQTYSLIYTQQQSTLSHLDLLIFFVPFIMSTINLPAVNSPYLDRTLPVIFLHSTCSSQITEVPFFMADRLFAACSVCVSAVGVRWMTGLLVRDSLL